MFSNSLSIEEKVESRKGLCVLLTLQCLNCEFTTTTHSSPKSKNGFDINFRLVYGLRNIGKGCESAKKLCAIMDLPPPPTKFWDYNNKLLPEVKECTLQSMKAAAKDAIQKSESNELAISLDGTWQKRGHNSLNGVMTAISMENGKLLDLECLSKHCQACKNKTCLGGDLCNANFTGSSGSMEVAGAKAIFSRSEFLHDAKYKNYLGDGDSKAFVSVVADKPYGPN